MAGVESSCSLSNNKKLIIHCGASPTYNTVAGDRDTFNSAQYDDAALTPLVIVRTNVVSYGLLQPDIANSICMKVFPTEKTKQQTFMLGS